MYKVLLILACLALTHLGKRIKEKERSLEAWTPATAGAIVGSVVVAPLVVPSSAFASQLASRTEPASTYEGSPLASLETLRDFARRCDDHKHPGAVIEDTVQSLARHRSSVRTPRACVHMSWAEAKKKREEEDKIKFAEMEVLREQEAVKRKAEVEAAVKAEREAAEKREKERMRLQSFQDSVDFQNIDGRTGAVRDAPRKLTKGDLENSQVMRSPVIDAEARLQDATAKAGSLESQDAAIALLREVVGEADAARVPAQSPQRKAAAALLFAFEQAAEQAKASTPKDPMQSTMDAIFSDEYMVFGLDDDLV